MPGAPPCAQMRAAPPRAFGPPLPRRRGPETAGCATPAPPDCFGGSRIDGSARRQAAEARGGRSGRRRGTARGRLGTGASGATPEPHFRTHLSAAGSTASGFQPLAVRAQRLGPGSRRDRGTWNGYAPCPTAVARPSRRTQVSRSRTAFQRAPPPPSLGQAVGRPSVVTNRQAWHAARACSVRGIAVMRHRR